ncbi:hypothetical protein ACOSQ4_006545 [Xanthoceras sorbifolium]
MHTYNKSNKFAKSLVNVSVFSQQTTPTTDSICNHQDSSGKYYRLDKENSTSCINRDKSTMPNLPEEIVADILSRLPVNGLMRFKCVCKPWLSLISNPQFAKTQLKQSRTASHNTTTNLKRLLFLASCPLQSIDYEAFGNSGDGGHVSQEHAYPTRKAPEWDVQIVGSCDGLICLVFDYCNMVLWNPSTRVSKELPAPDDLVDHDQGTFFCGFGCDISIDDYKVIKGVFSTASDGLKETKVQVLTLKNNSWRQIQYGYQSGVSIYGMGTLSNNSLHWLGSKESENGFNNNYCIISFDLSEERFEEVGIPDHIDKDYFANLGSMGDSLVIFCNPGGSHFESWVMKDYGVKSSWTRLFRVSSDTFPGYKYGPTLICFTTQGKAVVDIDESELILYNPEEETFKHFMIKDDWGLFESVVYEESLVSPNGDER